MSDAMAPKSREIARPWKIGSVRMTRPPTTTASAVSIIGRNRTAPDSTHASASDRPWLSRSSMKSTKMIELRTTMPAPAINPIIDVAVKNAPISACAGRMPTSENGITVITINGVV